MKEEISKAYDPSEVEEKWYSFWEKGNFFYANSRSKKPAYCISIPPPNVTGTLHMGHALVDTLQDILIRYKRMSGYETLWVPGTDHAGIATQTVVERDLIAKTGKRRKDFSREEFLKIVWKWKEDSEKRILEQLKKIGCSCDWSRLCFTMDDKRTFAVNAIFEKMFHDGLIYRGDYLVNWDPVTQTALADDEVEYEEKESFLWYIRYPTEDEKKFITVATTRPETMLGDVAVAVHPEDRRFKNFHGKHLRLPFINRLIPLIADSSVDPNFGTGAVKITPAHDLNDYEMAKRHRLEMINIMTPDGKINEKGAIFQDLTMEEARLAIVKKLEELDLLEKVEKHTHRVGISYRSNAVIEPYLSKQWFVRMDRFKEKLISAVKEKRVKIIPEQWENTYFHWIENLRDWCISRQLWWGHRIPIWYKKSDFHQMICFKGPGIPHEVAKNPHDWVQDEDVLDTWFSSAIWPFSVLGWPEKTEDLKKFYPNSTLITGHDILFFWVARMILMGEYALNEVPFKETFIHGLIYGKSYFRLSKDGSISYITGKEKAGYDSGKSIPSDVYSKWEKMSKSKGNVIDPLEICQSYGRDAMRITLCHAPALARHIDLDPRKFEEYKNYINKIWNSARFIFLHLHDLTSDSLIKKVDLSSLEDEWIISRLQQMIDNCHSYLEKYLFDRMVHELYHFYWDEFCSYYLELVKPILFGKKGSNEERQNKQKLLVILLCNLMRLLHPIIPFITEEIFQRLRERFKEITSSHAMDLYTSDTVQALLSPSCMVASYPIKEKVKPNLNKISIFSFLKDIIYKARNIRAEMQPPRDIQTPFYIVGEKTDYEFAHTHQFIISTLIPTSEIIFQSEEPDVPFFVSRPHNNLIIGFSLPLELREKRKEHLFKQKEKILVQKDKTEKKLLDEHFLTKAPKELIDQFKSQLHQSEREIEEIDKQLHLLD
ncbi:MAG: valine--tRNA ligase [Chlamydiae bacterium]|nr:valine--tRNA ligase [Chlamydiota bacterium]